MDINPDVIPQLWPADQVDKPEHLICGGCGFNATVEFYIVTDAPWVFEPVCNCPLEATFIA